MQIEKNGKRTEEMGGNEKRNGWDKSAMRLSFLKGDMIAIGGVLLLAGLVLVLFLPGKGRSIGRAEVYRDGELIRTVPLDRDTEFTVSGAYTNVITVRDGRIAVTEADCPGGDCVHSGWIGSPGRSLVCLPNRVEIRVVSDGSDADVDFIVG